MLAIALAALALASGLPPEPSLPLSPANLPPQIPPKEGACPNVCSRFVTMRGSVDDCQRKAAVTLSSMNGIRYVELKPEGVVWGYTESDRWIVQILDRKGDCIIVSTISSWSIIKTCLLDQFSDHIANATLDPKSPRKMGTRDIELEKKLPAIHWHLETKQTNSMTRHFRHLGSVAALFMEKYGYETMVNAPDINVASVIGRKLSEKSQVQTVLILEQVKGKSMFFLFICVGIDEEAQKDMKSVSTDLLKLLYE